MKRTRFWDFNARIFGEGVRQLKTVGILFTVVMCLEALLIPIGMAISMQNHVNVTRVLVTLPSVHPLIILPMYTLAPVGVLILFSFLNKRRTSDFYHAIPVTRAALFFSLLAAVLLWVIVSILASTAVSVVTCLCLPRYVQLTLSGIPMLLLNTLLGAAFVAACVALAMSITGTLFNNIVVAGLIFFTPRLLLAVCRLLIHSNVNILSQSTDGILLDASYNIPLGILTNALSTTGASSILHSYGSAAYTAVVTFLYLLAANLLFRVRKSEAAGNAAATPILQHVYRISVTFLVTLIPVSIIFTDLFNNDTSETNLFYVIVLYIISAIAFCVYELITTKKPKQLLKVAPSFLLVLAADGVMLLCVFLGCRNALAFRPTVDEITGVSLVAENSRSYFTKRGEDIILHNKDAYAIIADRLKVCAENNSTTSGLKDGNMDHRVVRIYTGNNRVHERRLALSDKQQEVLKNAILENEAYRKIFTLPKRDSSVSPSHSRLTTDEANAVYDTMQKEAQKLSFDQLYDLLSNGEYPDLHYTFTSLSLEVSYRNKVYSFEIPLTADYFPESYQLYLSYRYKSTKAMQDMLLDAMDNGVYIEAYDNSAGARQVLLSSLEMSTAQRAAFKAALLRKAPTTNDAFCRMWYEEYESRGGYTVYEAFFTLSDEALAILNACDPDEVITDQVPVTKPSK